MKKYTFYWLNGYVSVAVGVVKLDDNIIKFIFDNRTMSDLDYIQEEVIGL